MPDRGYHRYARFVYRARNALVIERPEILDRPAAAPCDYKVCNVKLIRVPYRADDLRRCLHALHAHRQQQHLRHRPAAAENADHVMHRRASGRGYDRDALRKLGQRLFMRAVKQSLFRQLCL